MEEATIVTLIGSALWQVIVIAAPPLIVSVVVGLIISILQAATSIQEQTLTFVPKLFAVFFTFIIIANWVIEGFTTFTYELFDMMWRIGRGGI